MNKYVLLTISLAISCALFAQTSEKKEDKGEFSGNFQTNAQFYMRDDRIGANTTQYLRELSSAEAWLFMNYKIKGFNFSVRYDLFNNSPLFNPQQAYSKSGIGFWQVSKDVDKFNFTLGYFYDQFGTGALFRAYEDRNIGIDFAIQGARVIYNFSENTRIKAFTGQQKFRFDIREPIIKGANIEHRMVFSDKLNAELGASVVNRTLDQNTMSSIASTINSYPLEQRFDPKYNVFGYNVYNTLNYKNFTWFVEYNLKTPEAILDYSNTLINKPGNIFYTSLSYSTTGFGVNVQFKRLESFLLRVNPLEIAPLPNNGPINYLPALTRQNTYRLLARYNAVVQELGENAAQLEFTLKPTKSLQINLNGSIVNTLAGLTFADGYVWNNQTKLFREVYTDVAYKFNKKFKAMVGVQSIGYNQQLFEGKASAPYVEALTLFGEMTYKLNTKRSLRFEWQYMNTEQDLGSFVNALVEYNVAPHWSFSAGDLVNFRSGFLNKPLPGEKFEIIHYYNFFTSYTYKTTRLTAAFLKQPQGVNCTGGVCRVEPAFSGGRLTITTNF
ncbi:MAG: DUF6029 family protein [Bacteroidia bacterium]|jgi:hypothetical protein|nr:DUF6029 family protein [Bacteroidia bacterium]